MRLVFVHGALVRDGAWWWSRMAPLLAEAGIDSVAVELPSCGGGGDLHDDAAAVRAALEASDEPALLCGHSYGGMVITEAAAPPARRLIFIDSFLPELGESIATLASGPPPYEPAGEGLVRLKPALMPLFVHDCDDEAVAGAEARLTAQSSVVFGQSPHSVGWRTLPSTYVVCAEDRATPPALQRAQARRASEVVELAAGHHPFLSQPAALAELIIRCGEQTDLPVR